jgi:hypothetical protein
MGKIEYLLRKFAYKYITPIQVKFNLLWCDDCGKHLKKGEVYCYESDIPYCKECYK